MLQNLSLTRKKLGASIEIAVKSVTAEISAQSANVAQGVNLLFNYGFVSNIPDDFEEGKDTFVLVKTDRDRLLHGCIAMASAQIDLKGNVERLRVVHDGKRVSIRPLVELYHASRILRQFKKETAFYATPYEINPYAKGIIHDVGWEQEHTNERYAITAD